MFSRLFAVPKSTVGRPRNPPTNCLFRCLSSHASDGETRSHSCSRCFRTVLSSLETSARSAPTSHPASSVVNPRLDLGRLERNCRADVP